MVLTKEFIAKKKATNCFLHNLLKLLIAGQVLTDLNSHLTGSDEKKK